MGWAGEHLSEDLRREIARSLFEVKNDDAARGWINGLCPLHEDTMPSFGYDYRKDVYKCHANCARSGGAGDLVKLWSLVHNLDPSEGFRQFKARFAPDVPSAPAGRSKQRGKVVDLPGAKKPAPGDATASASPPPPDSVIPEQVWAKLAPLPQAWIDKLAATRGWTPESMKALDLRMQTWFRRKKDGEICPVKGEPERIAIPVRDRTGQLVNVRLYKPGGSPKIISWGSGFGSAALFPPAPRSGSGPVLLCEGESDAICAISHGFNAITQTTKPKTWSDDQIAAFRDRDVIIAYDADQPGENYAQFAARNLAPVARSVRILRWPAYMGGGEGAALPKDKGEDLTDFFVKHGKAARDLEDLFATAVPVEKPRDEKMAVPYEFYAVGESGRMSFKPSLLVRRIMDDVRLLYDPKTGLLYQYDGRIWVQIPLESIQAKAIRYLGLEAKSNWVNDVASQVRILSAIEPRRDVNDRPGMVCLENGMFDLHAFTLRPHDPLDYATYKLGVRYDPDRTPTCERWLQFLVEVVQDPGAINQIQEFFGLCLTRETRYGKALLAVGPGSDGKSILLKILQAMTGFENCSSVSFRDLEDQFHRASLYGKLLNISTEVGSQALESPYFKAIVTGDTISASFKHQTPFQFTPFCKLAFACNKLPRVLDNSEGFFRRLLVIEFKRQFLGADADKHLEEKLLAELDGIFEWSLVGLARLREQCGFSNSDESARVLLDYKRANNPILCFVEDECRRGDGYEVDKSALYGRYKSYCSARNYKPANYENFFRELKSSMQHLKDFRPRSQDGTRQRKLLGIDVIPNFDKDAS